ncbi:hypothetical protein VTJ83DRAFT_2202 [Remersonia thermophila]|uniref:SH3 domain-containing protein n=1 Tax=Remersonia thermophila TaxID=72144 RepID=A0ABR4DI27_9PEZI
MTAVMSPGSSAATSPPALSSPESPSSSAAQHSSLSPLVTSPPPPLPPSSSSSSARRSNLSRPMSHASKNRLSQYSNAGSLPSRSRPQSHVFPLFPSSLPYTLVRDFAYPVTHPMHYGPPPEPSRPPSSHATPASEHGRSSDLPGSWDPRGGGWDPHHWPGSASHRPADLPSIQFTDGPPWSEDEDLQSPVVSSRHRKHKSSSAGLSGKSRSRGSVDNKGGGGGGGYYTGAGSEPCYGDGVNGQGGSEYVAYPPDGSAYPAGADQQPRQLGAAEGRDFGPEDDDSSSCSSDYYNRDESRYSRDYQFTITSPDEEMCGKAVALFDFERENESELPLVEGQIIWVSFRYGQGWLVAEDPKTQESGLVPEEYVRLLRDIEGGMNSLTGEGSPDAGTPTQAEHSSAFPNSSSASATSSSTTTTTAAAAAASTSSTTASGSTTNGYHQPVVSTFSTSSKDLDPYPQHLLGTHQAGQPPPQVVHYHGQRGGSLSGGSGSNSQANTPTLAAHNQAFGSRRGSVETGAAAAAAAASTTATTTTNKTKSDGGVNSNSSSSGTSSNGGGALETLPDARLETATTAEREKKRASR